MFEESSAANPVSEAEVSESQISSVTDEQVDNFFESGGRSIDIPSKEEPVKVKEEIPVQNQGVDNNQDHNNNYKAAMREERARRQELQRALQEQQERSSKLEQAYQDIMGRLQGNQPKEQVPSFEENPIDYLKYENQKLAQQIEQQNEYLRQQYNIARQREEEARQDYARHNFLNSYRASAAEYAKANPDWKEAYDYLNSSRMGELMAVGYTKEQADALLNQDEAAIVARAFEDGVNPAERIYTFAKYRGFKSKAIREELSFSEPEIPKSNGKIEQLEKGIKQSRSLGSGGGQPTSSKLTIDSIDEMSDKELDDLWKKMEKSS